jgi:hypothetical protein
MALFLWVKMKFMAKGNQAFRVLISETMHMQHDALGMQCFDQKKKLFQDPGIGW